jgi:hypothetical protein
LSPTDAANAGPSPGAPADRRGHGALAAEIALLILPVVILIAGLVMIGYMSPIYSGLRGLDYDPAYPYLFNGAGLMKGYNPGLIEHPGTPVQFAAGFVSVICWSIARLCGLTALAFPASIAANPEEYLRVIMTAFLAMNCAVIWWLGSAIAKATNAVAAGIACQCGYLLFGALFPRVFHLGAETFLFLAATGLMGALTPALFADRECSDKRAWAVGFFIALGISSKMTFAPLILLALLLGRRRPVMIAIAASGLFTLLLLIPILGQLKGVFAWMISIASHAGTYGTGSGGFVDWAAIPERLGRIAADEPLLVVAAAALIGVIVLSGSRDKRKAIVLAAAAGTLVLLVLKHFSIHYLVPAVAIAPAVIVWTISRLVRTNRPYTAAASAAAVIGVVSTWNMTLALAQERALRRENEKAINEAIARYDNPVVIGTYRSGYKPLAVLIGLAWSDWKFARLFPQTAAPDFLTYDSGLKKLWRAHSGAVDWSYLDQFEKAGRAVLLIQSRGSDRIEAPTAKIEPVLDQGFGDTVARIVVTPKAGN